MTAASDIIIINIYVNNRDKRNSLAVVRGVRQSRKAAVFLTYNGRYFRFVRFYLFSHYGHLLDVCADVLLLSAQDQLLVHIR